MDPSQPDPLLDATVFPVPKKVANNLDLPYRKLSLVEVLDQKSGEIPQALETLSTSGPFKIRGYVPIEETVYSKGLTNVDDTAEKLQNGEPKAVGEKFVYVQAENITEWTHEFNPKDPRNSIFWVLSRDVCWYQIQSVKDSYAPLFHPLKTVCTYLDTISHLVFESKVKDDLSILIPVLATILSQSESTVKQKLFENRERLTDLCASDANLRKLKVYGQWTEERASAEPTLPPLGDEPTIRETQSSFHEPVRAFNTDKIEVAAPEDSKEELYERLPAPCTEDLCPLHLPDFLKMESILSPDLETLIVSKYGRDDSGWSEAETFHCPVPGCLIAISSSICSSVTEFGCEIVQHIGKHDLSVDGNEDRFKDYLRYSSRVNNKPKSWDTMASQLNDNVQQDLNIQLYWALKAGDLQLSATPEKTSVARTTRTTRNATVKCTSLFLQPAPRINERPRRYIPPRPSTGASSRACKASSAPSTPQHRTSTLSGSNFIPPHDKTEVTEGPSGTNRTDSSADANGYTSPRQATTALMHERRFDTQHCTDTARTMAKNQSLDTLPVGATTIKIELRSTTADQPDLDSDTDDRGRHRSRKRKGIKPRNDSIEDARRRRIPKQLSRSEQSGEHDGVIHLPRLHSIKRLRPHVSSRTTDSDGGDRGKMRMEWSGSLQNDSVDDTESDVEFERGGSFETPVTLGNSRKRWVEEKHAGQSRRRISRDRHYTPMGSADDTETETDDGLRDRKRPRTVEPRRPYADDPSSTDFRATERTWAGLDPQREEGDGRRSRSLRIRDTEGNSFSSGDRRGRSDRGRGRSRVSSGSHSDSGSSDSGESSDARTSGSSRSRHSRSSDSSETSRISDSDSDGTGSSSSRSRSSRDRGSQSSSDDHEGQITPTARGGTERRVKQPSPVTMKCMKCSRFVRGATGHVCRG